jgi:hypothetical protein
MNGAGFEGFAKRKASFNLTAGLGNAENFLWSAEQSLLN